MMKFQKILVVIGFSFFIFACGGGDDNPAVDVCAQAYAVFISPDCQSEALAGFEAEADCEAQCGGVIDCIDACEGTAWDSMPSCYDGWPELFDQGGDPNEGICGQCYLDCDDEFGNCLDDVATCLEELTECAAACQ